MAVCAGCDQPIFDRYVHQVIDKPWHGACVTCFDCKAPLKERCFSREGRLFCRNDFLKRYGTKCGGCQRVIHTEDLVRRARDKVFHVACFRCMTCRKQLDTGEELYIINGCKFLCKNDYLNARQGYGPGSECGSEDGDLLDDDLLVVAAGVKDPAGSRSTDDHSPGGSSPDGSAGSASPGSSQHNQQGCSSGKGVDENGPGGGPGGQQVGGGTKRRGPRTTIKAKQLETLKAAFAATPKPTRHIREQLAQETGLNMRVIQVWFQNRRSKERRMKQLRFGSFRPGSRRSRNALLRDDPVAMMAGPAGAMFAEGLRRGDYYPPSGYYCDMFSLDHHHHEPPIGPSAAAPGPFVIPHPDESVLAGQEGQFVLDRGSSPSDQFQAHLHHHHHQHQQHHEHGFPPTGPDPTTPGAANNDPSAAANMTTW